MADPDEETGSVEPSEVIDARDDDQVDLDGPTDPLSAVLGGGGLDLGALMEQASELQSQMLAAQQQAAETEVEGVAGGGAVRIAVTGSFDFRSVTIDPDVVAEGDLEMLQDLVLAALHHAVDQVGELQRGSVDLGGLGSLFGEG